MGADGRETSNIRISLSRPLFMSRLIGLNKPVCINGDFFPFPFSLSLSLFIFLFPFLAFQNLLRKYFLGRAALSGNSCLVLALGVSNEAPGQWFELTHPVPTFSSFLFGVL